MVLGREAKSEGSMPAKGAYLAHGFSAIGNG
jgi:hypothetical protein